MTALSSVASSWSWPRRAKDQRFFLRHASDERHNLGFPTLLHERSIQGERALEPRDPFRYIVTVPKLPSQRSSDDTTIVTETSVQSPSVERDDSATPSLVVTWTAGDWGRVGSVVCVGDKRGGQVGLLGRGEPQFSDSHRRVSFVQQRPGEERILSKLSNPRISRQQLILTKRRSGYTVERVGRCRLLINGVETRAGEVREGDLLELAGQLHLLCSMRPGCLPELRSFPSASMPPFGQPDAFGFVGESPAAWALRDQLAFMARHNGHVLLLGPSGSGKELAAQTLHALSYLGRKAMVSRSAATFPATLIEAELFGNAKDYPNRGMAARPGLIGAADGSCLFLDEIAELPQELQARLLRVLDEGGEYHRLGEANARSACFRLIGATNRPMGDLRSDLAARMRLRLHLPDLNTRREDIPLLCVHLLRRAASSDPSLARRFFSDEQMCQPNVSGALMRALVLHPFDRNVRELDSLLWSSLASSRHDTLDLTESVSAELGASEQPSLESAGPMDYTPEQIQTCLDKHGGAQSKVWRELGFKNRHVLKRLVKKYGLRADKSE